jgi:general secretion pathway protein A
VNQFNQILIDRFKQRTNVVLIIDEAQNMPVETMESLRILSNLETSKEKLLQIILVGQPELEDKLMLRELRQLRQRIAIKTTIAPLSKKECFQYINHRLATASRNGSTLFTQQALKMIIAESRGVPRLMNVLCDNALITGFGYQKMSITPGIVREVINDFQGKKISAFESRLLIAVTAGLVLATGIFLAVLFRDHAFSPATVLQQSALQQDGDTPDAEKGDVHHKVQPAEDSGRGRVLGKTLAPEP